MKPFSKFYLLVCSLLVLSLTLACVFSAAAPPSPQADPNAFNTKVAQTAAAATPLQIGGGNTAAPPTDIPPSQPLSDEQSIKQALTAQLGWSESQMDFTLTASDGSAAYGTIKQKGQDGGAAWFAAKDASGKWVILHVGQGWPLCRAIQPYNFPVSYIPSCEDDSGTVIDRSSGQSSAPPSNPTVAAPPQADLYAPDPLGPAWTGFWFAPGACYDMDLLSPAGGAECDLFLDANNILVPKNGALFDAAPYQYAPSLNTCKSAALTTASMDAAQITYVCFKTNAGRHGFIILRDVNPAGIVFDAYLFP